MEYQFFSTRKISRTKRRRVQRLWNVLPYLAVTLLVVLGVQSLQKLKNVPQIDNRTFHNILSNEYDTRRLEALQADDVVESCDESMLMYVAKSTFQIQSNNSPSNFIQVIK